LPRSEPATQRRQWPGRGESERRVQRMPSRPMAPATRGSQAVTSQAMGVAPRQSTPRSGAASRTPAAPRVTPPRGADRAHKAGGRQDNRRDVRQN
jgi:hypothetical protein